MADQPVRRGLSNLALSQKRDVAVMRTLADIVLVIDGSASMAPILDAVKESALTFYDRMIDGLSVRRRVDRMRLKVIVYRDLYRDENPFEESLFFDLPGEAEDFRRFMENVGARGGGGPQSGLEALWRAIHADFQNDDSEWGGRKIRRIISLITDAPAHPLDSPQRLSCPNYPYHAPHNLQKLEDEWEGMDPHHRWLRLYAPEVYPWPELVREWTQVGLTPFAPEAFSAHAVNIYESVLAVIRASI